MLEAGTEGEPGADGEGEDKLMEIAGDAIEQEREVVGDWVVDVGTTGGVEFALVIGISMISARGGANDLELEAGEAEVEAGREATGGEEMDWCRSTVEGLLLAGGE